MGQPVRRACYLIAPFAVQHKVCTTLESMHPVLAVVQPSCSPCDLFPRLSELIFALTGKVCPVLANIWGAADVLYWHRVCHQATFRGRSFLLHNQTTWTAEHKGERDANVMQISVVSLQSWHCSHCFLSQTGESREIYHFHYTTWPDFGVPESPASFLNFLLKVRESGSLGPEHGPSVVHCSAGIGRSGTFALVDTCLVLVRTEGNTI